MWQGAKGDKAVFFQVHYMWSLDLYSRSHYYTHVQDTVQTINHILDFFMSISVTKLKTACV